MILLWWSAALATQPGRALTLPLCGDEACLDAAPVLADFAADFTLRTPPLTGDVRLGWDADGLLVSVRDLPAGFAVEVTALVDEQDDVHRVAGYSDRLGAGLHHVPLDPKPKIGEIRGLYVGLVSAEGARGPRYAWTLDPAAPDALRSVPALLAERPAASIPISARIEGGVLHVDAPDAQYLQVTEEREFLPRGAPLERGPVFTTFNRASTLETAVLDTDVWYRIQALAYDANAKAARIGVARIHHGGASAAALTTTWRPEPVVADLESRLYDLRGARTVCAEDDDLLPAAALFAEEAARLLGAALDVAVCDRGDVRFLKGGVPTDGFDVAVRGRGIEVVSSNRRGAVYAAVALVDVAAANQGVPHGFVSDAPELERRWLYWRIDARPLRQGFPQDDWEVYVRRVLTRGRYAAVFLNLRDAWSPPSHPELAGHHAMDAAAVDALIGALTELGIEAYPAMDSPGHADWILRAHPEMAEHDNPTLLCVRRPDVQALVVDVMQDYLDRFDQPPFLHVGADEAFWSQSRMSESQRCPRCSGTPRGVLFGEHLDGVGRWLLDRGVTPVAWADMVIPEWNGKAEGVDRALERLSPDVHASIVWMPWANYGDGNEWMVGEGLRVVHAMTGHGDQRRRVLGRISSQVEGSSLALFYQWPWNGALAQYDVAWEYAWPHAILAGWTAWRPALSSVPIGPSLEALVDTPAFRPGFQAGMRGTPSFLTFDARPDPTFPPVVLPPRLTVANGTFEPRPVAVVTEGAPLTVPVGQKVVGLAVLQASARTRDAGIELPTSVFLTGGEAPLVAKLVITYDDGATSEQELRLGLHTADVNGPLEAAFLVGIPGSVRVASPAMAADDPRGRDRQVHRVDWVNPDPEKVVRELRVEVSDDQAALGVYAVTAVR